LCFLFFSSAEAVPPRDGTGDGDLDSSQPSGVGERGRLAEERERERDREKDLDRDGERDKERDGVKDRERLR